MSGFGDAPFGTSPFGAGSTGGSAGPATLVGSGARSPGGVDVVVFNAAYVPQRRVADYISCSLTWQYLGAGTGTIEVAEDDPVAELFLSANTLSVIPVVCTVGGQRWSGRVVSADLERSGPPGTGTVTATLVDEWAWLQAMLASQSGSSSSLTGMPAYDTQTDTAGVVAAHYINAAATRLGAPVVASIPVPDDSPSITINARMQTLSDLLTSALTAANVNLPGVLWLPGDPQPPQLPNALSSPTIVFTPQQVTAKPWLRWSDTVGGITKVNITVKAPTANRIMLGLTGQDAGRLYYQYVDDGAVAADGPYGLPESYVDASDVPLNAEAYSRGQQEMPDRRGSVSAAIEVQDGVPWTFGSAGYQVGDMATLAIGPAGELQQRVTRVTVTDDRDNGLVYAPLVGDAAAAASGDELVIRAVSNIAQQLSLLQTGR